MRGLESLWREASDGEMWQVPGSWGLESSSNGCARFRGFDPTHDTEAGYGPPFEPSGVGARELNCCRSGGVGRRHRHSEARFGGGRHDAGPRPRCRPQEI